MDAAASVDYTSPLSRRADLPRTREAGVEGTEDTKGAELAAAAAFSAIGASYWYLLALGTFAVSAVLPVPDRLPLVPGWPTMEADTVQLRRVLDIRPPAAAPRRPPPSVAVRRHRHLALGPRLDPCLPRSVHGGARVAGRVTSHTSQSSCTFEDKLFSLVNMISIKVTLTCVAQKVLNF